MSDLFRIFGAELSPYSVKVRSWFRYKQIPHQWLSRGDDPDIYQRLAKLPLVPLVVTPEDQGIQDSTPIIEKLEEQFSYPSIHPEDPMTAFISVLLEEFGDEWGNKWMFHYRWAREADQKSAARRIAESMMPGADEAQVEQAVDQIRGRMVDRVWFVGSNAQTAPQIEQSYQDMLDLLDAHLAERPYLFGGRPAFGDFGLWGQIYNTDTDPTPGAILREKAPHVKTWVDRMLTPEAEGEFESWDSLAPTLAPLLSKQVGGQFLPWSVANAKALEDGAEEYSLELAGQTWTQKPQKYHARSLMALRQKYAAIQGNKALDIVLAETGCLEYLQ
ncbi:MAG: glutathione S-transferase family protein [Pseudomonadota bacterium]